MEMLKPGESIKPELDPKQVDDLLKQLYGISKCWVEALQGYDDKNYHIKMSDSTEKINNSYIEQEENISKSDFILKITNSLDSKNAQQFEAHKTVMLFLRDEGFCVQKPLRNVNGEYYSLETFGSKRHMVRLLTYLPGTILNSIDITNDLVYKLGVQVAKLNLSLAKFRHPFYDTYKSVWMLQELTQVRGFLYVVKSEEKQKLVEQCVQEFEDKVLSKLHLFEKGVIHGDLNEQNILVNIHEDESPREQFSILDFGDSHHSCLIFDLALTITYMILEARRLDIGAYVLAGYSTIRKLPYLELKVLKSCITARLCQSLVLGLYTFEQDPSNKYVLGTQDYGWKMLDVLYKYDAHKLINHWTQIMKDLNDYENDTFNLDWMPE